MFSESCLYEKNILAQIILESALMYGPRTAITAQIVKKVLRNEKLVETQKETAVVAIISATPIP